MKLHIKYMVSLRCKLLVKSELDKLGLHCGTVELGEVDVMEDLTAEQRAKLKYGLQIAGLELMDDKKSVLIGKIKSIIIEMVHYEPELPRIKHSVYISQKLHHDYTYLANLFAEATGITIEQYIISHKIEKVKELLLYDELSLTEISYLLDYSSVAHLSNQFKKVTGLTPTYFKDLKLHKKRLVLESL
jgi:AraC-like DNA-binding protein